jgi:hypothetical protein
MFAHDFLFLNFVGDCEVEANITRLRKTGRDKHFYKLAVLRFLLYLINRGTLLRGGGGPLMVAQWLRYCATNQKVAGSIPDGVIGIFH